MSKAGKEFWLFLDSAVEYKHFGPQRVEQLKERQIHLVEYAALEAEQQRSAKLAEALEQTKTDLGANLICGCVSDPTVRNSLCWNCAIGMRISKALKSYRGGC